MGGGAPNSEARLIEIPKPEGNENKYLTTDGKYLYWNQYQIIVIRNAPIGGIISFSGTFGGEGNRYPIDVESGEPDPYWVLCDGQETNGIPVPDLRNRFIIGSSEIYPQDSIGGTLEHSHTLSGIVGETTLTEAQMPKHRHTFGKGTYGVYAEATGNTSSTQNTNYTGGSEPHTHELSDGEMGITSHIPPYYSLAYIMRIA